MIHNICESKKKPVFAVLMALLMNDLEVVHAIGDTEVVVLAL